MQTELEFVKEQLALRTREEWFGVEKGSGVPFSTIKKIAYGQTENPRGDTIGELAKYLRRHRRRPVRAKRLARAAAAAA